MGAFVKTPMIKRVLSVALAAAFIGGLSGCASTANNPKDPSEGFNRAMFTFNDKLYFWVLKPVAKGYSRILPQPLRIGVKNIYSNIRTPVRLVNCALQGEFAGAWTELERFVLNTEIIARAAGVGDDDVLDAHQPSISM